MVLTQPDANGGYFAASVTVQRTSGGRVVAETVPYEVLAFADEAQALQEAVTRAKAYINAAHK